MVESPQSEQLRKRTRRERWVLAVAGVASLALPLLAREKLHHRVSVELAEQASEVLGLPIELGQASVGLTGTLEIRDIRVGEFFRAKRLMASIAPSASSARGLAPNELLIDGPRLELSIDRSGKTNLDAMLARRKSRHSEASTTPRKSSSRLGTLRFVNGSLLVHVADAGTVESRGINLWMREGKIHALFGRTDVALHKGDFQVQGTMPRAALDYRRGIGLHRLLADGGAMAVKGPRGRATLNEIMLSSGVDGDHYQMSAQAGIDRATGSIRVRAQPTLGGVDVTASLAEAPLALFAPWLPMTVEPRLARVSGNVELKARTADRGSLALAMQDMHLAELGVNEPALSRRQIDVDLWLDASATLRRTDVGTLITGTLESMRSGDLELMGTASGQWRDGERLPDLAQIDLRLADVPCDAALSSLPAGLRPSLAGLELRGRMESRLALGLARSASEATHLEVSSGIDGCKVAAEPPVANTRSLRGDYEHRTPDGRTRVLHASNPGFVDYDSLPSYVPKAFVAAEDARFFKHEGFDPHQIERSLAIDMQNGKLLRGGSTISQQVVKNLFLNRRRSLARKLQEAVLTWRLESNLKKKRILEIYLNIIELGDNDTYGIAEASERWFGIEPSELGILQTAFLAAMTPEPTSMSARIREAGKLDPVSAGRVAIILRAMKRSRVISSSEYRKAKSKRLELRSQAPQQHTAANTP
tara:strand:- start:38710 stop:40824 length:2115 start_codon:yes stop_codon:yes gene_type:complete